MTIRKPVNYERLKIINYNSFFLLLIFNKICLVNILTLEKPKHIASLAIENNIKEIKNGCTYKSPNMYNYT